MPVPHNGPYRRGGDSHSGIISDFGNSTLALTKSWRRFYSKSIIESGLELTSAAEPGTK